MPTTAELLDNARALLQMAVDFQGYREWRPGEVKRIEAFLDQTVAGVEDPPALLRPTLAVEDRLATAVAEEWAREGLLGYLEDDWRSAIVRRRALVGIRAVFDALLAAHA